VTGFPQPAYPPARRVTTSSSEILATLTSHPVLYTAPHGHFHMRDGVPKHREDNTARLATEAARLSGARTLVLTARSHEDGNWDGRSRFRTMVTEVLQADPGVLIDIHGMRDEHGPDLIVGTSGGRTPAWLLDAVTAGASRFSIPTEVRDHGHLSAGPRTLTAMVLGELAMPAVQLEFAARVRDAYLSPRRFDEIVRFLAGIADTAQAADRQARP